MAALALAGAVVAVATAVPARAAGAGPAEAGVSLPSVPSVIPAGQNCLGALTDKAPDAPWTQGMLSLGTVWQLTQGEGVNVAVVDTGVARGTPGLSGKVSTVGEGGTDCVGHGSFVAGIVAAGPLTGVGFTGVAPGARVLAVRGTDERGNATASSVAAGVRAAVDNGAKVVDVSLALSSGSRALASAVAYARSHDALVVAPAVPDTASVGGTADQSAQRDYWPAAYPGVLSVLDFGATGGRPSGALVPRSVKLAGPGDQVVGPGPRGGVLVGTGSSAATAFVAGAAALVRSYRPELSESQVGRRLISTAYPADVPRVDPYAAVTGELRTGTPAKVSGPPAVVLPALSSDDGAMRRAGVMTGTVVVALLVLAAVATARRHHRRRFAAGAAAEADRGTEAGRGGGSGGMEAGGPYEDDELRAASAGVGAPAGQSPMTEMQDIHPRRAGGRATGCRPHRWARFSTTP
ncbi:S8 family serine peptidase, partial [Streptomyces sp. NPDC058469]|uniref:S8 family serine peptidase n=1 Tax=Streptomyces sp. NPDC058469 TaxID=3346514 RepID=UPI0036525016